MADNQNKSNVSLNGNIVNGTYNMTCNLIRSENGKNVYNCVDTKKFQLETITDNELAISAIPAAPQVQLTPEEIQRYMNEYSFMSS